MHSLPEEAMGPTSYGVEEAEPSDGAIDDGAVGEGVEIVVDGGWKNV